MNNENIFLTEGNLKALNHYLTFWNIEKFKFIVNNGRMYFFSVSKVNVTDGTVYYRFNDALFNVHETPVKSEYFSAVCNISFNCSSSAGFETFADACKEMIKAYNNKLQEIENKQ